MKSTGLKTTVALVLMTFALLSVPGASLGGAGLNLAEAQHGTAPESASPTQAPEIEAQAWALIDANGGRYLMGENPDEQLPIGSVTKIMSALVVLEEGVDLDEEVTISREAESYVGTTYSNVGLIAGERVTVRDLLVAALIPSGTEAVYALAEHVGDGSVENFVGIMNEEAYEMGLENTNFETPAGLDTTGNYSSARDLALTAREALDYSLFAELVDTPEATISTQNREIEIFNTNQLLNTYPPATGVKSGTTAQGGFNLIVSAESDDKSFIAVVLGAEDPDQRFRAAQAILEYGFERYEREPLVRQGEAYGELSPPYRRGESVELVAVEDVTGLLISGSEPERQVTTEEPPQKAEAGEELGEVEVFVDGQSVGRSSLVTWEGYAEATLWDKAWYAAGWPAERAWAWFAG